MFAVIYLPSGFGFCGCSEFPSALRGECPCGGPIDWRELRGAQGSSGSTNVHDLNAAKAAAMRRLAPTGEKVPSAAGAASDSLGVPRIQGNTPRAGRMPAQPRPRANGKERDEEAPGCEPVHGEGGA
eukprot:3541735-Amphidinium_carterae.1